MQLPEHNNYASKCIHMIDLKKRDILIEIELDKIICYEISHKWLSLIQHDPERQNELSR